MCLSIYPDIIVRWHVFVYGADGAMWLCCAHTGRLFGAAYCQSGDTFIAPQIDLKRPLLLLVMRDKYCMAVVFPDT